VLDYWYYYGLGMTCVVNDIQMYQ